MSAKLQIIESLSNISYLIRILKWFRKQNYGSGKRFRTQAVQYRGIGFMGKIKY